MLGRMEFVGQWRDYQKRVIGEADDHFSDGKLHLVAAPGAGKTVVGLELVRRIGRPALIFSPTTAIREQWVERIVPLFLSEPPSPDEISRSLDDPRVMTIATYQALDAFRRRGAREEEDAEDGAEGEEEAENEVAADANSALTALIAKLNAQGPFTLVLDEAHHLRREWWHSLDRLARELTDVRIIALTATPPYDASFAEWTRYEKLCGTIDLEIGIPELVRNNDLCPHQDHIILSYPTADALALLDGRRKAIARIQSELSADEPLLDYLAAHPWLTDPESHIEAILASPEMLSAVLMQLHIAGRPLPSAPLKLLGVSARDIPDPSADWMQRYLDGIIHPPLRDIFHIGDERRSHYKKQLQQAGLIEGSRVRLHHTRSLFRMLSSSLAKLDSITAIAQAESESLGDDLRMVILSDHIRADQFSSPHTRHYQPAKLGVVPIFETVRRAGIAADHLAILTGSLVVIPRGAKEQALALAPALNIAPETLRFSALPSSPDYLKVEFTSGGTAQSVRLITALFKRGAVTILVGTQSLLGEGWDAPVLNTLVLASNTASYMLSNQMRGRAIRIDPSQPNKVANIWHLATIEPPVRHSSAEEQATQPVTAAPADLLNWGVLHDGAAGDMTDADILVRRFRAFEGISNGASCLIESGVGRLGIDPNQPAGDANARSFAIASDRTRIADHWATSLGEGTPQSRVRETAAPNYAPRRLSWFDTLSALTISAGASASTAMGFQLYKMGFAATPMMIVTGLAGAATAASLPKLAKAGMLAWRNGSLESSLVEVGKAVLDGLCAAKLASDGEKQASIFSVHDSIDGRKDVIVTGVSRNTERQVMLALAELLGPVQNPRYLLVRKSRLGLRSRTDYHAVPTALGAKKADAEAFCAAWNAHVGSSTLVYTRTPEGRRLLLRARAKSFAGGFQRSVDRRSAWL